MSAYYNEHDPFAAKWLRELIKAGHIADGEVDERSIEDVLPSDLAGFTQCHFFAGIGVWSYALKQAGWPDDEPVWTGSCPCQPFSTAGKRAGIADERHLWPSWFHLIAQRRPPVIFGEQVEAAVRQGWLDLVQADLEGLDYACGPVGIPAAGFGAPHARQRLYFAAERVDDTASQRRQHEQDGGRSKLARNGKAERRSESGTGSSTSDVADAISGYQHGDSRSSRERTDQGDEWRWREVKTNSGVSSGDVADASNLRCHEQRPAEAAALQGQCAERSGEHAQPEHTGELSWRPEGLRRAGELGNPSSSLLIRERPCQDRVVERWETLQQDHQEANADNAARSGPTNGFWAAADWLWCRDQKYRPVEPGTFPLAHGSPNRVGRLRGYGNAIVAPQAEAFIRAYIETRQNQGAECQR